MEWNENAKICRLLKFIQDSNEFYIMKRLYGVLFLLIFVVTFYPDAILSGTDFGSLGERLFKGTIFFALAWRAMRFQLREMWVFPEGKLGRLYSIILPSLFIVGVYFAYDVHSNNYWMYNIAVVTFFYALKPAAIRYYLTNGGTYFMEPITDDDYDDLSIKYPLRNWMRNTFSLSALFLITGIIGSLVESTEVQWILDISKWNWYIIGAVNTLDPIITVVLLALMFGYTRYSDSHYYETYIGELADLLRERDTINPWLVRDGNKDYTTKKKENVVTNIVDEK